MVEVVEARGQHAGVVFFAPGLVTREAMPKGTHAQLCQTVTCNTHMAREHTNTHTHARTHTHTHTHTHPQSGEG
jgi:hypothetical protein